jgi:UDP-N-acetylmuramate--alanine ligase
MNFGHIKSIHFVGIGGIGMSGIAAILSNYDYVISGCDAKGTAVTDLLQRSGIDVRVGHQAGHVENVDLVVYSSAIKPDHPEVVAARRRGIPVVRRAEMLGEIMRWKHGVAVAGTHGKTTTSAMTAMVLSEAGLDPTVIVGGMLRNLEANTRFGKSDLLVVEADEYDRSFLALHPHVAVITNIEADHLDCYRDLDDIRATFEQFASGVPFYGLVIGCTDDENVAALLRRVSRRTAGYGLGSAADLRATQIEFTSTGSRFDVSLRGTGVGRFQLNVPGEHNVCNSLAAIAVGLEMNVPVAKISAGLEGFRGVERRFQHLGQCNGAVIIDDYAHHPTEIRATLAAARMSYPDRRLVALFQPHLFTRTRDFATEFADALNEADVALVMPIYPARELPIEGVTAALITEAARRRRDTAVTLIDMKNDEIVGQLKRTLRENDVLVAMGAGDVNKIAEALVEEGR